MRAQGICSKEKGPLFLILRAFCAHQPRSQGLLLFQNGGRRNSWTMLQKYSKTSGVFCHVKHVKMSSFRLNNGFGLLENKHDCKSLEIILSELLSARLVDLEIVCTGSGRLILTNGKRSK